MAEDQADHQEIATLTAEIVGAYVSHHTVAASDLPGLIATVGKELTGLGETPAEPEQETVKPSVPIKRSVADDHLICLICGKPQKMLKRHLATRHDLEPEGYRAMFRLKEDYPLVAPAYAATRSALAKKIGLGRKPAEPKKPARRKTAKKPAAKKSKA